MTRVVSGHPGLAGKSSRARALAFSSASGSPTCSHFTKSKMPGSVFGELVPVAACEVQHQLAMLQRGADGLPGPGVQHCGQLPEVAKQQELHVGVQPHARQVRPERHVQLGNLLNHEPVKFLHAPVRTYLRTQ